jgi:hypothetical protein
LNASDDELRRSTQEVGYYVHCIGDITLLAISDGYLDGTLDALRNIEPDEARQILAENLGPRATYRKR